MGASETTGDFESWTFEGLPGRTLHVGLFTNVTNCKYVLVLLYMHQDDRSDLGPPSCRELQNKVKAGKVEPEVAMLNAAVVS